MQVRFLCPPGLYGTEGPLICARRKKNLESVRSKMTSPPPPHTHTHARTHARTRASVLFLSWISLSLSSPFSLYCLIRTLAPCTTCLYCSLSFLLSLYKHVYVFLCLSSETAATNWRSSAPHARRMINEDNGTVINPLNGFSSPLRLSQKRSFFPSFLTHLWNDCGHQYVAVRTFFLLNDVHIVTKVIFVHKEAQRARSLRCKPRNRS
jgi:hypothetical protein